MKGRSKRFEFLDGLRGIAAILVVVQHFLVLFHQRLDNKFSLLFTKFIFDGWLGHLGVQFFFVLSGFVIAYSIRNKNITPSFIGQFFIRRSIRLDPPYWIALLFLVTLIWLGNAFLKKGIEYLPNFSDFFINAVYLPRFTETKLILPVAWTLCLEIQFYMVFILLLGLVQEIARKQKISSCYSSNPCLIIFGIFFLLSLSLAIKGNLHPNQAWFIFYWHSFFLGCLTCWALENLFPKKYYFIALLLVTGYGFFDPTFEMWEAGSISFVIYSLGIMEKLHVYLKESLFQFLGKISYSLYLIHWPIGMKFISLSFYFMGGNPNNLVLILLFFASIIISIGFSYLFYQCVEQPSLTFSHKVGLKTQIAS